MTCSPARLAANRANAQKSTGPRTEEGKARSRANALKHGLCSQVVSPEDHESIGARRADWFFALKPQNEYHSWLLDRLAVISLRIDRAERMERRLRDRRSLRAEVAWDDDGRLEAERLGVRLSTRPAEILEQLRRTPSGCDWLISRWSMLARAADLKDGRWTAEQVRLAFDLLGTPAEFREGLDPGEALDEHGRVADPAGGRAALARREVDALIARRAEVADLDEVDRELARSDLFDESYPELKKLRRYEGTLHNRLRWCLSEMRYVSPHFKPCPELTLRHISKPPTDAEIEAEATPTARPAAGAAAASAPPPRPKPDPNAPWSVDSLHPPFCLETHEIPKDGSRANPFQVLLTREEKRVKKAEARREARRRKAEQLRA